MLRDNLEEFTRLVSLYASSREEWVYCRDNWNSQDDEVKKAAMWFYVSRLSFAGAFGSSWASAVSHSRRGMAGTISAYLSAIDRLPEISDRLKKVQIENTDALSVIKRYTTDNSFCYCDPPYVQSTRESKNVYSIEMSDEDHRNLVDMLLDTKGYVILSGYNSEIYRTLEYNGWDKIDNVSVIWSQRRKNIKEEKTVLNRKIDSLWLNPKMKTFVESI